MKRKFDKITGIIEICDNLFQVMNDQIINANTDTNVCPVCLMEVECSECCNLDCSHPLHVECAEGLRQLKCPICRKELRGSKLSKNVINKILDNASKDKKEEEGFALRRTDDLIRNLICENEVNTSNHSLLLSFALERILRHPDLNYFLTILSDLRFDPIVCMPIIKKLVENVVI